MAWTCDGEDDCMKSEDEMNCGTVEQCGHDMFHCLESSGCIQMAYLCNGIYDCADQSDELNCNKQTGLKYFFKYFFCSLVPVRVKI